ncbi:MAG: hypothetical protein QM534_16480 [Sediminibacterium sp.]|nr:hypothetical protein [Sediminibacterium sp.]
MWWLDRLRKLFFVLSGGVIWNCSGDGHFTVKNEERNIKTVKWTDASRKKCLLAREDTQAWNMNRFRQVQFSVW